MRLRLLLALVGLAINFAAPAFAQQTNTSVSDQDHLQIEDLIAKKLEDQQERCRRRGHDLH